MPLLNDTTNSSKHDGCRASKMKEMTPNLPGKVTIKKQVLKGFLFLVAEATHTSDSDPPSPSKFLLSATSRKTLIYLILTLNHMYPDYDFSAVEAHQYSGKEWSEANGGGSSFLESLYKALDEVVKLGEFEMYSYSPDSDGDPFSEKGALWSFKSKRYRALCATIKHICNGGFLPLRRKPLQGTLTIVDFNAAKDDDLGELSGGSTKKDVSS
ncbi:hypothetical protein ACHQM5_015860 [Ranunculus cassubicifolius]